MDLLPTADQSRIVESFRQFLCAELPLERLNAPGDTPPDDHRHWPAMAGLGWFGIGIDESHGGAGMSMAEEMLLCIEAGRQLVSPSLLGTLLGAHAAVHAREHRLADAILAGECVVALALEGGIEAHGAGGVSASLHIVGAADEAAMRRGCVLVATPQGCSLLRCETLATPVPLPCLDESVRLGRLRIDAAVPAAFVPAAANDLYLRGMLLGAAMSVGIADRARQASVDYAGQRRQFGQPIGSFQAIKHGCADMALRCESALSMLTQASLEFVEQGAECAFDARAAKLLAAQAAIGNAEQAIQVHGAMGFTREMPIHVLLKRAHLLNALFGTRAQLLSELAALPTPA